MSVHLATDVACGFLHFKLRLLAKFTPFSLYLLV
jgi:hypothetical protein